MSGNVNDKMVDMQKGSVNVPFFSVVIATYNRKSTILRAVNSLLNQTEKDWEAIIVDDGSTDNTFSALREILATHKNIKYIKQDNKGAAATKNVGLQHSSGKFFTFLDSDDEYEPLHLASRKKILEENPSAKFLSGGIKIIGSPYVPDRFDSNKQIHLDNCEIGGTFFICKELLYSLNGFNNIHLGEDADLFERIKKTGSIMLKTDIPTYIYHRETEGSITNLFVKPVE
ncbi:MAG TPA: glycosyltransferase family A protein [Bacteroidia bacterium]|nr:glycosyltransferase family A protein [Bacteroidia bacterium]